MKNVLVVLALFTSFLFMSCSESIEDQSLASFQMEKTVKGPQFDNNFSYLTKFNSIPVKEWQPSNAMEGIEITLGCSMQTFDYVFAVLEKSGLQKSELIFLQKISDVYVLPNVSTSDIKDIRVYGICTWMEIGNYPYSYLQTFTSLGVETWGDGGESIKVVASEWNSSSNNLFAEIYSESQRLLIYVGNPQSKDFELPTFEIKDVTGLNLFATYRTSEIPHERK